MGEPFIGQIMITSFNFAPRGWALCNGQLLPINQNQALFSLLGTYYGGDGRVNFGIPDFRGRVPVHMGTGPGLPNHAIGEKSGTETVTLTANNIPAHNHAFALPAVTTTGNSTDPNPNVSLAASANGTPVYSPTTANTTLKPGATGATGASQPVSILQPYQTLNFIIALQGIYPSRP